MPLFDLANTPPLAQRVKHSIRRHGHHRDEPYLWMQAPQSAAMQTHLLAENAYADAVMAPTEALQNTLYQEMLGRIQETDLSVPVPWQGAMYYTRTEAGLDYAIHCRKAIVDGHWQASPEEVLLDENIAAKGHDYFELGDYEMSPSGRYLAWTEDVRGDRSYRLRIRDLATGRILRIRRNDVASLAWAEDDMTLFYVSCEAATRRAATLWRHSLFEAADTQIYHERDQRFNLWLAATRSRRYLLLMIASHTTSEVRLLPADRPMGRWRRLLPRQAGVQYDIDHHGEQIYLRINDQGPNYRLLNLPCDQWQREYWRECLAQREDVVFEGIDCYAQHALICERVDGLPRLSVARYGEHGQLERITPIELADPTAVIDSEDLPDWHSSQVRYSVESFIAPEALYDFDLASSSASLLKTQAVPGYQADAYRTARLNARSADGTQIPISLVHHRDTPIDGSAPLWLEGYGAYGVPSDPWFSASRVSLLDRGWVFALAHVRGGGEFGQTWHDGGRLANKPNSFDDFIACAQALVDAHYSARGRILAHGGSAGGLLVAAALNRDAELFGAAILDVPFVDVLSTMLNPDLPLTVGEYEEWGDPRKVLDYQRILAWSPIDALRPQAFPPMLIESALHDSQVMIWEPAKYAAHLRALSTSGAPILFRTHMEAGHGGASGRYEQIHERARQIAFAITALGPTRQST